MSVVSNYKNLISNVKSTCKKHNRNFDEINIVAVSKQQEAKKIDLLSSAGHSCFGENRLDEVLSKWKYIDRKNIKLHFIGALQSKKVKDIIKIFDVIETLDTESAAEKISMLKNRNLKIPKIYVQINIGEESQKRGVKPNDFSQFLNMCVKKYNLKISGAMCMPPLDKEPNKYFKDMVYICRKEKLENISMGMSNDYKEAIIAGANNIRVGSLVFGERGKKN